MALAARGRGTSFDLFRRRKVGLDDNVFERPQPLIVIVPGRIVERTASGRPAPGLPISGPYSRFFRGGKGEERGIAARSSRRRARFRPSWHGLRRRTLPLPAERGKP